MNRIRGLLGAMLVFAAVACASGQSPVLGSIEAPYAPLQSVVTVAKTTWAPGLAAYGPVNTPLILSGSNLGESGVVQFWAYKNGAVDTSVGVNGAVAAAVTLWTSTMLTLSVPPGAASGLVTVTVNGQTSNGLPFIVTPGTYSGSCPAGPTGTQLQIITSSLHDGSVGDSYSATLGASGGTGSYVWSIASGNLPAGLSFSTTGTISGVPTAATGSDPSPITFRVVDSGSPPQTDEALISLVVKAQGMVFASSIYSYTVAYDGAGNVTQFKDGTYNNGPGIMGTWDMSVAASGAEGYDSLNRLTAAGATWPDGTQKYYCWAYDAFGNRTAQSMQTTACPSQESSLTPTQTYSSNNRINSGYVSYDGTGNVTGDVSTGNIYLYDAEGRVCAVMNQSYQGIQTMTGYLYDSDGNRVAKGKISSMSCDPIKAGFDFSESYVVGTSGEELTTLDGNNTWQRTNIYADGRLIGTYDLVNDPSSPSQEIPWLHFHLLDPLGTRRMQVSGMIANLGQPEIDFQNLPFGDHPTSVTDPYANQTAEDASPLHFTGKERDSESGNDYFGARYYASAMGRFLSPDWSAKATPVPYAKLSDPQSLNLYAYVRNNPLSMTDPDGHGWWSDYWQKVGNNFKYGEFVTNAQLPAAFASERSWLIKNAAANQSAVSMLQGASNQQINQLFGSYRAAFGAMLAEGSPWSKAADPRNFALVGGAVLYRGGDFSNVRPNEYKLDADGNVRGAADATSHGPSLFDDPAKIPPRFNVVNPVTEEMLGPNLTAVPRGRTAGHFEVVPRESGMAPETFLEELGKILERVEPIE